MKNIENKAKIIGARIKAAREEAGYPQVKLAQVLGFESATAISLIESGERNITAENLERIAKTLNKGIQYFIGESNDSPDIRVALRADKDLTAADQEAILHFIELAKKNHANRRRN